MSGVGSGISVKWRMSSGVGFSCAFECLNQTALSCWSNAFMSAFVLRNIFEKMDLAAGGRQMFPWMCLTPSIGKLEVGFDHQL